MNPELTSVPPPMTPQDLMNRHHQSAGQLPSGMPMLQPPPMNNIIAGSDIPPPVIPGFPIPHNPFATFKKPFMQNNFRAPNPFQKINVGGGGSQIGNRAPYQGHKQPYQGKKPNPGQANANKDQIQLTDCNFFMTSVCSRGDSCFFRHSEPAKASSEACSKWLQTGICIKECPGRHPKLDQKKIAQNARFKTNNYKTNSLKTIGCKFEKTTGCSNAVCPYMHAKYRTIGETVFAPTDNSTQGSGQPNEAMGNGDTKPAQNTSFSVIDDESLLLQRVQEQFKEVAADKTRIDHLLQTEQRRIIDVAPPKLTFPGFPNNPGFPPIIPQPLIQTTLTSLPNPSSIQPPPQHIFIRPNAIKQESVPEHQILQTQASNTSEKSDIPISNQSKTIYVKAKKEKKEKKERKDKKSKKEKKKKRKAEKMMRSLSRSPSRSCSASSSDDSKSRKIAKNAKDLLPGDFTSDSDCHRTTSGDYDEDLRRVNRRKSSDEQSENTLRLQLYKHHETKKASERDAKLKKKEEKAQKKADKQRKQEMESMKQELREKSAELNNLKNGDMAVLKVSQSKSPIRARLDYDDERDNERDNDSCSESDESRDADFSITIKQDVQNSEDRRGGKKASDARSLIRQNKIEREAAGGRLTSNSSDDYVHPSEQKHRHDKIKRANEALRHQKEKPDKSEKTEKQHEKSQKSSQKASIFDRIKQNQDSNRDSRGNSRENSPELPAVDKKRRRIIIQNKNERTSSPTVDEAAPLPPHSILQGTDSSKSDKSLKKRKIVVKRGSTDMDSTDTDSSLKRQRANKPLPGSTKSDRKPEKLASTSNNSESNTLLLKPKPKLVMGLMSGIASNNTVISTESQNYLKKSQLQINQTLNVQKPIRTRKASEDDNRSMRKCSVNSEALDSAVDQHLGEVGERIMAKNHKSVIKPKNVQNGEEGEIDDEEPAKPKRHVSTTSDGNHDVLNLHDEDPDEEALLRELDDYLND